MQAERKAVGSPGKRGVRFFDVAADEAEPDTGQSVQEHTAARRMWQKRMHWRRVRQRRGG